MATVSFGMEELAGMGIDSKNIKGITDRLGMSLDALDDKTAVIDITPNRVDMLDIIGFGRAVSFLTAKSVPKERQYSLKNKPIMQLKATRASKKVQPFITAMVVKDVDLSGSKLKNIINFTEKLCDTYGRKRRKMSMGLYNYDAIKGPITYDASSEGEFVPLGWNKKANFPEILKEHEKGREYSSILGRSRICPFLRDTNGIIALIPVINSESTRVTEKTKNLFIDITSKSKRTAESAMSMIACLFIDSGAEVYPCEILYESSNKTTSSPLLEYRSVKIRKTKVEKTLGVFIEDNKIITLANRMGYVAAKYGSYSLIYVPPYRLDVLNEQDVIEDIAIAYGYDRIEPMPIAGFSTGIPEEAAEFMNGISRLMLGLGFTEAMNPYLTNEELNFRQMDRKYDEKSIIRVAYAKTEAITMLRTDLLPRLMENLGDSIHERTPQKIFETGKVFRLDSGKVVEADSIGIVSLHPKANYSEIKSIMVQLLALTGIKDYKLKELEDGAFIEGRAASIIVGGETIGKLGEISPKVLRNFKLEEPAVAAEINANALMR